jgi:hypothetical protein
VVNIPNTNFDYLDTNEIEFINKGNNINFWMENVLTMKMRFNVKIELAMYLYCLYNIAWLVV